MNDPTPPTPTPTPTPIAAPAIAILGPKTGDTVTSPVDLTGTVTGTTEGVGAGLYDANMQPVETGPTVVSEGIFSCRFSDIAPGQYYVGACIDNVTPLVCTQQGPFTVAAAP